MRAVTEAAFAVLVRKTSPDPADSQRLRLVGVDVGGTSSRARLVADGRVVADVEGRTASPVAAGSDAAAALDDLLARLPLDPRQPIAAACVGAAGLSGAGSRELFEGRLRQLTSGGPIVVVDDGLLVLPAAGLDEGVGVVCGTGSIAYGRYRGRTVRAGGWGYLLGDEAGGFWLAREALRVLLGRADGDRPLGPLGSDLDSAVGGGGLRGLVERLYREPTPRRWAALAPAVLNSSDPAVDGLLADAASAVGRLVELVEIQLSAPAALPVVLAGGLTGHDRYREAVLGRLRQAPKGRLVEILTAAPVAGAVRLAAEAASGSPSSASPQPGPAAG